jgi:GNAT superfamily N-acetyltransferase
MTFARPPLRGGSWIALILLSLGLCACGDGEAGRDFVRLDRLVFVPAASCFLVREMRVPVDCSNAEPLLVDCFEVTRGEWLAWAESKSPELTRRPAKGPWLDEEGRHPATGMNLIEAQEFAAAEGMRIPTAREWLRIAVGTRGQPFPWGPVPRASVANTGELGLMHLAPVGSFEAGRTPSGVYDLLGNVAEWVLAIDVRSLSASGDTRTWAMGGSYLSRMRSTYQFDLDAEGNVAYNAALLDPRSRSNDLGVRLVADAEAWLRDQSSTWPTDPSSLRRLEHVGASWGASAAPLLKRLATESRPCPALEALLRGAQS